MRRALAVLLTLTPNLTLALAVVILAGCPRDPPPPPAADEERTPAVPKVDPAFLARAFGAGFALANQPLVADLDRRPGSEALLAIHSGGKRHQVAVVRGDGTVLARAPLGGKILAHATINFVGEFRASDELLTDGRAYLMPVETMVYHRAVCGILVFRYRPDSLALIGEFAARCWRKEAGADGGDPFAAMRIARRADQVEVTMQEEQGETRVYRWDAAQAAFLSLAPSRKR